MSLKVKLISCISLFMLMLGVLIIGVFAATQQQLTMQGSVSFNVPDKSLYVKDVRIKQDMASEPESIDSFMPGYINGEFNLDLTGLTEENTYGSFTLYFDMINTTDIFWQITEVDLGSLVSDGVSEEHGGLVEVGAGEDTIINNSTKPDGTLTLTIMAPNADADNPVVLDGIVITIDEYIPQEITDFTFNNLSDSTGELVSYNGTETEVVIPNSYSIYQGKFVEGSKYTVTSIAAGDSETTFSSTVFDASITKVTLPEGLINIGEYAFASLNLTGTITIPSTVETIGDSAFINCFELKGVNLRNCTNLKTIDDYAFYLCYNTTGELYIPASVTSIGLRAFSYTGFTSINVDANNQYFSSENRALYNKDKTTLICGLDRSGTFTAPASVTRLEDYALESLQSCELVDLSACTNLTYIGYLAIPVNANVRLGVTTPPTSYAEFNPTTSIEVPSESLDDYKADPVWGKYADQIVGV